MSGQDDEGLELHIVTEEKVRIADADKCLARAGPDCQWVDETKTNDGSTIRKVRSEVADWMEDRQEGSEVGKYFGEEEEVVAARYGGTEKLEMLIISDSNGYNYGIGKDSTEKRTSDRV
ncbi:hypothetical protein LTR17_020304 [Elasticomyces elasticus]|nr:hypothetical protein LTR17_020304 [Elasticomyces elasticus]